MKPTLMHAIFRTVLALAIGFHLGSWSRQSHLDFWIKSTKTAEEIIQKQFKLLESVSKTRDDWRDIAAKCHKEKIDAQINNAKNARIKF